MTASSDGNGRAPPPGGDLTCRELVELVTAYLEDALPTPERRRFEAHIRDCPGCDTYLAQMRQTVEAVGRLREEDLAPDRRERLLAAFRGWRNA